MRILIEEHQYPAELVSKELEGISTLQDLDGKISVSYVGYYYNPALDDCVFILPKVLMSDTNEKVFGKYAPEDIIDLNHQTLLEKPEYDFIYELTVWIYRAVVVYRDTHPDSKIVRQLQVQRMTKGRLQRSNTFLDILLELQKFNKENQNFFFFVLRNQHSGLNKINWTRTIAHSPAFVQDNSPIYLDPVNKKRRINFDEELLIIFFSILNYMHRHFGFPVQINLNFPLITDKQFENYLKGMGKVRLMQIKYKYFSDKALYLWELCYAFFDRSKQINIETNAKEYLLVQNFNIVFEAIIDELIAGDQSLPVDLKEQEDGKRVDHMFMYQTLTNNEKVDDRIYYIGDSKYYKRGHEVGQESVYKQFTYARNVIQWNMDLFNDETRTTEQQGHIPLRDEVSEGYNIIPNFFISAEQNTLQHNDDIQLSQGVSPQFTSRQFENRLFDRDTFLIAHYDVNFLFVISLYGQNNKHDKAVWREKARALFRKNMQEMLQKNFNFYVMSAHADVNAPLFIQDHFQQLLGKVFTPYEDRGLQKFYSLALDIRPEFKDENDAVLALLEPSFEVKECHMGDDPKQLLAYVEPQGIGAVAPQSFLTMHYLEKYLDRYLLIGSYHDQEHWEWITGKNDKGSKLYNVRLDRARHGAQSQTYLNRLGVSFVILYEEHHESENRYRVFRVHHHAVMDEDRMRKAWYKNPHGKYFCYVFDEEVSLGNLDLSSLITDHRHSHPDEAPYSPIFMTGEKVRGYRK